MLFGSCLPARERAAEPGAAAKQPPHTADCRGPKGDRRRWGTPANLPQVVAAVHAQPEAVRMKHFLDHTLGLE